MLDLPRLLAFVGGGWKHIRRTQSCVCGFAGRSGGTSGVEKDERVPVEARVDAY